MKKAGMTMVFIALKNTVCVLAWVALAIYFRKWWIALFGMLFLTSVETSSKHAMSCDGCGRHSPYADSFNSAIDKAEAAGWLRFKNDNGQFEDYCPKCRVEREREGL